MEVPSEEEFIFGQCLNFYCDEFPCTFFASKPTRPKSCVNCCCMDFQHEMLWKKRNDRWFCTVSKRVPSHFTQPSKLFSPPLAPPPTHLETARRTAAILRRYETPNQKSRSSTDAIPDSNATLYADDSPEDETFMGVGVGNNKRSFNETK